MKSCRIHIMGASGAGAIEWASHYDAGDREGRSLTRHQQWVAALPCPVLRLDGSQPLPELVAEVRMTLGKF
jgi:hypothetical protein